MNYPKIAKELLTLLGGKSNITALAHCATRLRLAVADQDKIDEQAIDNLEGVKG
ncbi:PTS transporter subunit EIIB, partial [Vibrio sp. 10N.222.55.C6]